MKEQLEKMRADNPKITEQFADLKRDLAQVGALVWLGYGMHRACCMADQAHGFGAAASTACGETWT